MSAGKNASWGQIHPAHRLSHLTLTFGKGNLAIFYILGYVKFANNGGKGI